MSAPTNAIQQRLQKLEALWTEFTDDESARVLRWTTDSDTEAMLRLFVDLQNEEQSQIPDLFVSVKAPFDGRRHYSQTVIQSLQAQYVEIRNELAADGLASDWAPRRADSAGTCGELLAVLASFYACYKELMEHLVLVLDPPEIRNQSTWHDWWTDLISEPVPPGIRFVVNDRLQNPLLDSLAQQFPKLVMSVDPQLNMPGAWEEIVAVVPGTGPGHDFRKCFVALTNAAAKGNVKQAEAAAAQAVAIAGQQQWQYLVSTAKMALAAAYFTAGNLSAAVQSYRHANQAIAGSDDAAAKKMDVPTRMAEGSALIAAEEYEEAASVFRSAAEAARQHQEQAAELDCWRMAGWCHETAGQPEQAWECGEQALEVAAGIEPADRQTSTLPYAGQMLLRLADSGTHRSRRNEIQERMTELAGEHWASGLVQSSNS